MSENDIKEAVEAALHPLTTRLDRLNARVDRLAAQRNLLLLVTVLALIVAGAAIFYALNREAAFKDQVATNQLVVCSQARSTAVAAYTRQPQMDETHSQFVERMISQRQFLLASGRLNCETLPGFDTFEFLRGRGLAEIDAILRKIAPKRLKQLEEIESPPAPDPTSNSGRVSQSAPMSSALESPSGTPNGSSPSPQKPTPHPPSGGKPGDGGSGGGGGQGGQGGSGGPGGQGGAPAPEPGDSDGEGEPPPESDGGGGGNLGQTAEDVVGEVLDTTCTLPVGQKALCPR